MFRDFPNISRTCIFFLLTLSLSLSLSLFYSSLFYSCYSSTLLSSTLLSSTLLSSLFYSSLLSDSSHLCFSSLHIVGSLTSKLPLVTWKVDGATPMYWLTAPLTKAPWSCAIYFHHSVNEPSKKERWRTKTF